MIILLAVIRHAYNPRRLILWISDAQLTISACWSFEAMDPECLDRKFIWQWWLVFADLCMSAIFMLMIDFMDVFACSQSVMVARHGFEVI